MRRVDHEYWESVKGSHKGERAWILATGPSLRDLDVGRLRDEYTVGVNHLILWKDLPFIPSAWGASESDERYVVSGELKHLDIPKWWANQGWPDFDDSWAWLYKDPKMGLHQDDFDWLGDSDTLGFGAEFWRVANAYSPVQDVAIPVLCWMGFTEIYLLGVDHTANTGHVYSSDIDEDVENRRKQRIGASDKAYRNILPILEMRGITLRNCSPGSQAPVPYIEFESIL
jgi:hypothetical protein